ncbi:unnamed protein product, partial [Staurois parvus]
QCSISLKCWQVIWDSAAKTSRCVVYKENLYKVMLHWYKTPVVLHAITQICLISDGDAWEE